MPDTVAVVLRRIDLRGQDTSVPEAAALTGLPRPDVTGEEPLAVVREIIARVRAEGDAALTELTARLDGVSGIGPIVGPEETQRALADTEAATVDALRSAADAIASYHRSLMHPAAEWINPATGVRVTTSMSPVRRAGCYVPGGRAAYPSTVLMTAVVARVAGVSEVVLAVPPSVEHQGVAPITLAAAAIAGVDEVVAAGGAQAIAALAYGTESIAPVDMICGPGNRFVALAKQEVAGQVGVASAFAGPSEVVVVADGSAPAEFVAIDLIVQAEHGPDGLAWLVTWDEEVADAVERSLVDLVARSERRSDIEATLAAGGFCALVDGPEAALAVVDHIAPEHLELMTADPEGLAARVRNAGAIFCGPWAPASIGDYAAGPNHVLPTFGTARFASALTVTDFCRHHHVVSVDREAFGRVGPVVATLARAEGLTAHARSVELRSESTWTTPESPDEPR